MMRHSNTILLTIIAILPACATRQISYQRDITTILDDNCNGCHMAPDGYGYKATGLNMDTYDALMKGTIYGPIIIAGDSQRSIFNKLIEGRAGNMQQITHGEKEKISEEEIKILKIWVNQGALNN